MARVSFKHRSEYVFLLILAAVVRRLPRKSALALGQTLGHWSMKFLPQRYRLAKENLRKAFPEMGQAKLEETLRKNFEHLGISGVEMLRLDMYKPGSSDLHDYFDVEGIEYLQEALKLEKGVLLLGGHLGFWEAGFFILSEYGIPLDAVAKPMKNPLVDRYFAEIRKTFGSEILNSRKGARRILQSLRSGRVAGVLLDQHISPPGSVQTDFFGRKAYTTTAITNMAMKYQVPVVPLFSLRQADGRYRFWFEPMLMLEGDGDVAVAENTQLLTDKIEAAVRKDVSQWFWVHKRWRDKPKWKKGKDSE